MIISAKGYFAIGLCSEKGTKINWHIGLFRCKATVRPTPALGANVAVRRDGPRMDGERVRLISLSENET